MKKYTITWIEEAQAWSFNGILRNFVGDCLAEIAMENDITTAANSESHHLSIIRSAGIEVNLLEEDGSEVVW